MTFSENISLQNYVDSANQKFNESEHTLSEIEGSFQTRMNGKTTTGWKIKRDIKERKDF